MGASIQKRQDFTAKYRQSAQERAGGGGGGACIHFRLLAHTCTRDACVSRWRHACYPSCLMVARSCGWKSNSTVRGIPHVSSHKQHLSHHGPNVYLLPPHIDVATSVDASTEYLSAIKHYPVEVSEHSPSRPTPSELQPVLLGPISRSVKPAFTSAGCQRRRAKTTTKEEASRRRRLRRLRAQGRGPRARPPSRGTG